MTYPSSMCSGMLSGKRTFLIIAVVLIALGVSSCQGGLLSRQSSIVVHAGNQGIVPQFMQNAPPARISENAQAPLIVQLENNGAFGVINGQYIIGGDSGFLSIDNADGSFSVEGRSKINPFPGKSLIEKKLRTGELDPQRQVHDASITATICYPYETHAGLNVCIDTDPLNLAQRKKVCSPSVVSGSGGQGGPVAVTEVEPSMIPEGDAVVPSFVVRIANVGTGLVVDPRKVSLACQPLVQSKDLFDVVELNARLTDTPLSCDSKVKLRDGKAEVECVAVESFDRALGSYMAPLTINLKYGYTQSISAPVKIERHPGLR